MPSPDIDHPPKTTRGKSCIVIKPTGVPKLLTIVTTSDVQEIEIDVIVLMVAHLLRITNV